MRDVFVVNTPLQLLNAIEARAAYDSADSHLLILHWARWPRRAFEGLLKRSRWSSVTWLPLDIHKPEWRFQPLELSERLAEYVWTWRRAGQRRKLEAAFRRYGNSIDRLAIGNYCQPYMLHVLNTVPHRRSVALDDGTDALKAAEQRRQALAIGPLPGKGGLLARWANMDDRHPRSVEFFSVYDLPPTPGMTLRRHAYEQLHAASHYRPQASQVFFLGQPLVEDGYLAAGDFTTLLRKVQRHYADRELLYVPHKRETEVSRSIAAAVGLRTMEFDDPIEIVLASGERQPGVLSSFFCSALENCGLILGERLKIEAVRIPEPMLLAAEDEVARIYAYLAQSKSTAISLLDL